MLAIVNRTAPAGVNQKQFNLGPQKRQVTISDNYAMLCGQGYGHIATGKVVSTSGPYRGADYHISVQVLVADDAVLERYHMERWTIKFLELSDD